MGGAGGGHHVVMANRTPTRTERPEGLVYRPEFITAGHERELLGLLERLEFHEVRMRGQVARRTVRHFGFDYGYESWKIRRGEPLPPELEPLRAAAAELIGLEPDALAQTLVASYPPGAGIGWHRDAPMFGPQIVGVSLGAPARMRFKRRVGGVREVYELPLEPRSAYVLGGKARTAWQHSVPATKGLRYSITFRTVKEGSRWREDGETAAGERA